MKQTKKSCQGPEPMSAKELRAALKELYGWGGQTKFAVALDIWPQTVRRWLKEDLPIPGYAAACLRCFLREKRRNTA